MEYIKINEKEFKFVVGTGKDYKFRKSFNTLTEKTFGFNFESWYQNGYWKNKYIPYSLMDGDVVVSNVSVSTMDFQVFGKAKRYIQLGTVMTDVKYRNQGLLRIIMERIIAEWRDKCELIYLFANNSVLDFYPKFGFNKLQEYQCSKLINKKDKCGLARKLDMSNEQDKALVYSKANNSCSLSKIHMDGNTELIMFYCTLFMKNNAYYIEDYDAVVIAEFKEDTIEVLDVFCTKEISLDKILNCLINENIKREKLYFTPKEIESYTIMPLEGEDALFILGKDTKLLAENQFMFPKLSHT
jgi:predicted N-acetyltransferase YhbS